MNASETAKAGLRQKFKGLRKDFAEHAGRRTTADLHANLERFLSDYPEAQICLYHAHGCEAPCPLEPHFFYPVIGGEDLQFYRPKSAHDFVPGPLGILQPDPGRSQALDEQKPTVVCCPAVALDSFGARLGMGRGFYDRYFAKHPRCLRVGVVFQVQISRDPLPADSWDQTLDWIVSEKMILRPNSSTRSPQSWI